MARLGYILSLAASVSVSQYLPVIPFPLHHRHQPTVIDTRLDKVLLLVEQLRAANQSTQSTLNAVRFLASRMSEAIDEFVSSLKGIRVSQAGGSGYALEYIFSTVSAQKLSSILHSNLLSLSSLLQMACYSKSDDDAWKSASVTPRWIDERSEFPHVRLSAKIRARDTCCARPSKYWYNLQCVPKPIDFFRPGRVFTVAIRGISTATGDEDIDCTHLPSTWIPLDFIPDPYEREKERLTRQMKNYEDGIKLPLPAMFQYGDVHENGQVQYEMSTDCPILSAPEVEEMMDNEYNLPTWTMDPWVGAITIRRFVVVQQGSKSCLCLGIYTYSGRGRSDQPDQELYAKLHSSRHIPDLLPEELGMNNQPIRLKLNSHQQCCPEPPASTSAASMRSNTPSGLQASPDKDQAGTSADDTVTQTDVKIEK
ncbi:hypothetical protein BO83DRAFT_398012 [Aspergillus eucalypticola CBS 122712]|uniref:DUF6590 domain-containing protein n=1 Tax=Aspergillus eucalypticola (strain CBS 122712 / IBT 29274) TaxID=1448314 RepID=A0A317VS90_ASPEC|nr:uncharacterized protein BO83DRAFT_398012 [Aspergillus eucalypticola CBS 122712]PWY75897.1 hypothetical protein BO83DRAFT_398012 [Aspergillus eucalypticola CBS 122712]